MLGYIIQNTLFMLRNMYSRFDGGSSDHIYLKTVQKPAMEMYLFRMFYFAMKYCFSQTKFAIYPNISYY